VAISKSTAGTGRMSPWIAAAASAVLPGGGQLYAGKTRRAVALFSVDAGLLIVALLAVVNEREVAKLLTDQRWLTWFMVTNLALLGYRLWAADDAYRAASQATHDETGPARRNLGASAAVLVALLIVLVTPHAVFAYYDIVTYSALDIFAEEDVAAPTVTTTSVRPAPTGTAGNGGTTPDATTTTIPRATGPAIWDGLERLNILLLGGDAGFGRTGIRTDTMIVVSIDPETGDTAMFSIPRNYASAPLPEGMGIWDCNCFPQLLTDLYYVAASYPEAFPGPGEPGVNAIKAAMGELFGIEIHYYALVTLDGFVGIVDALGGVDIDVPVAIIDETYPHEDGVTIEDVEIPPGRQHLDGHLALAYARMRRHANDFARMNRQRCVLEAVLEQSSPTELLASYGRIVGVLKDHLSTDIPQRRLADFIDLLPKVNTERVLTMRITSEDYLAGFDASGQNIYDAERIRADALLILTSPETAAAQLGIGSLDETCS
jgi:LCP family protein required for cell wall assembly